MISLLFSVCITVILFALAVWIMGQLAPGHPALIDNALWVLCVLVVLMIVARAFGVYDPPLPRLR